MSQTSNFYKLYQFFEEEAMNPLDEFDCEEIEYLEDKSTEYILSKTHSKIMYLIYWNQEGGEREQKIVKGLKKFMKEKDDKFVGIMLQHLADVEVKFNYYCKLQLKIQAYRKLIKHEKYFLDALYSPKTILGQKKINKLYDENL